MIQIVTKPQRDLVQSKRIAQANVQQIPGHDTEKKKKEEKYKLVDSIKLKKIEMTITAFVGVIFLVLLILSMTNVVYLPATLISFALFLFCICYYYIEDESKKKLVYILFSLGVILIIVEVIYTLVKIR